MSNPNSVRELLFSSHRPQPFSLSECLRIYRPRNLSCDYAAFFGGPEDGVIEMISETQQQQLPVLSGYYYGAGKPKNIIAMSTMVGCPKKCGFCPLGPLSFTRSLTAEEVVEQVLLTVSKALLGGIYIDKVDHKLTLAKAGEPFLNKHFPEILELLCGFPFSLKVSTVFPLGPMVEENFWSILRHNGAPVSPIQLQISILSTDEKRRQQIAGGAVADFAQLQKALRDWKGVSHLKRKPNLSITVTAEEAKLSEGILRWITPDLANFRLRPYIPTNAGNDSNLKTISAEQVDALAAELSSHGFEVSCAGVPSPVETKYNISSVSEIEIYSRRLNG